MLFTLDACSLIAFFEHEKGYQRVEDILSDRTNRITMHSVNACELYYHFVRNAGEKTADQVIRDIIILGTEMFDEIDPKLWKAAGILKARYKRLSLADAIGVAYANRIRSTFLTSDHTELDPLAQDRVCKILFFR